MGPFAGSGLAVSLFLGGWTAPVSWLDWVPSCAWFFGKLPPTRRSPMFAEEPKEWFKECAIFLDR